MFKSFTFVGTNDPSATSNIYVKTVSGWTPAATTGKAVVPANVSIDMIPSDSYLYKTWMKHVNYDPNAVEVTKHDDRHEVVFRCSRGYRSAVIEVEGKGTFTIYAADTFTLAFAQPEKPAKKENPYGMTEYALPALTEEDLELLEAEAATNREVAELLTEDDVLSDDLPTCEGVLFAKREQVEVLWLEIGKVCAHIVDKKLYRQALDENGNPFRSANAYFHDLDKRFHERGLNIGRTTMTRFMADYRLFIEGESGVALTPEEAVTVGKSNLEALAPAVRKLKKEGEHEKAATLVRDVVSAAKANGGLPTAEVNAAVDEYTDRVMKGLQVEFTNGLFGKKLSKLTLWWGGQPRDILNAEVTEEQAQWVARRLGVKLGNLP